MKERTSSQLCGSISSLKKYEGDRTRWSFSSVSYSLSFWAKKNPSEYIHQATLKKHVHSSLEKNLPTFFTSVRMVIFVPLLLWSFKSMFVVNLKIDFRQEWEQIYLLGKTCRRLLSNMNMWAERKWSLVKDDGNATESLLCASYSYFWIHNVLLHIIDQE